MGKCLLLFVLLLMKLFGGNSKEVKQSKIPTYKAPKVYWQIPSFQCTRYKLNFTSMLDRFNIIHNPDSQFSGETITILYNPGYFPALLATDNGTVYKNGGVPQEGNLTLHLKVLKESIRAKIPNENYSGLAILNFEDWKPIFRQHWGRLTVYKDVIAKIEKEKHPTWNKDLLTKKGIMRFEAAAKIFMKESLNLAKQLRPKGKWGYYHYPYSYTNGTQESVSKEVQDEHDRISWLWKGSDAFYPSVYMLAAQSLKLQIKFVETTLDEVLRIKNKFNSRAGVYVYVSYTYVDTNAFIPEEHLAKILTAIAGYDVEGVVLWGASPDVNSARKCQLLYDYIDYVFGPTVCDVCVLPLPIYHTIPTL